MTTGIDCSLEYKVKLTLKMFLGEETEEGYECPTQLRIRVPPRSEIGGQSRYGTGVI